MNVYSIHVRGHAHRISVFYMIQLMLDVHSIDHICEIIMVFKRLKCIHHLQKEATR